VKGCSDGIVDFVVLLPSDEPSDVPESLAGSVQLVLVGMPHPEADEDVGVDDGDDDERQPALWLQPPIDLYVDGELPLCVRSPLERLRVFASQVGALFRRELVYVVPGAD